jgi:diadenosine tetraphosphatase ApaH/serine/threonine PP2A family protein phosphatase
MLIAILSDIHGNREAFDACVAAAKKAGAERFALLGDLVGYGADPSYIVDSCAQMAADGAILVMGNHDEAMQGSLANMNDYARAALEWTRGQLDVAQKNFLKDLPRWREEGDALYVHSEASNPQRWIYVESEAQAERSLATTSKLVTFCGHIHRPQLYNMAPGQPAQKFIPRGVTPTPLMRSRKWLAVMGAVGQPRDENPSAAFALYDDVARTISYRRAAYDIDRAAQKIKNAGLPAILSARLYVGR